MRLFLPLPRLALGGLVGLGIIAGAYLAKGQVSISSQGLLGSEFVEIAQGGAGGSSIFTTTGRLSSGYSNVFFSAFPSSFTVGTLAGAVNTAAMVNGGVALINAANTAQTFTMPPNPVIDGTIIGFCNVTNAAWATNAVTIAANTGQTLSVNNTLTTLGAGNCGRFIWNQAQATWYRVQ